MVARGMSESGRNRPGSTPFLHRLGDSAGFPTDPLPLPTILTRHRWRLLTCLALLLALAAGIGLRAPTPPDEPRFVLAARAMVETGQWLLPHRGSELYAEKPPVFMWIQAATYQVIGNWNLAFLLPSLLAGLATLWLSLDLARRLDRVDSACIMQI